ncbi:MAG TPA: response regulator [Rhizorhapis sp.]|nr:response regulator [Rhizorhapis sp.]
MDPQVFIVDDDPGVRNSLRILLEAADFNALSFASARQFLDGEDARHGCLITDVRMPDMNGVELLEEIIRRQMNLAVIIMTGHGDVPMAVRAMNAGAVDFLEKPFDAEVLLASVQRALLIGSQAHSRDAQTKAAKDLLALLTPRERNVLDKLVKGRSNKVTALKLGISPRTVESHRAKIMDKMQVSSLSDLVRVVVAAGPEIAAP